MKIMKVLSIEQRENDHNDVALCTKREAIYIADSVFVEAALQLALPILYPGPRTLKLTTITLTLSNDPLANASFAKLFAP